MGFLGNMTQRIISGWKGFSGGQKALSFILAIALIGGGVALYSLFGRSSMSPLFTGLAGSDASAVADMLAADGVPYELSDGGATILVPQDKVYGERIKAAAGGLPSDATGGYALLDKMGVTSSEFQQSVTYKRAIEGELANTIRSIQGINNASVQIAIPKATVFTEQAKNPTASVFVETASGATLTDDQVNAIVHLTASSIEGMQPADVSVVDSSGKVLTLSKTDPAAGNDKNTVAYEQKVKEQVQAMLDQIVGPGNSTVAVSATLSMDSSKIISESFSDPVPSAAPLTETTKTESYQGTGSNATGILGPDNIAVPNGTDGATNYTNTTTDRTNSVNKVTEDRTVPAGAVARQTISVAINSAAPVQPNVTDLTALVSAAAGIDPARGDSVVVQSLDFDASTATEAQTALEASAKDAEAQRLNDLIKLGITVGAIVIPVVLALLLFLRRGKERREPVEIPAAPAPAPEPAAPAPAPAPAPPVVEQADLPPSDIEMKRAEVTRIAAQDPEKAAQYLRGLMDDSK